MTMTIEEINKMLQGIRSPESAKSHADLESINIDSSDESEVTTVIRRTPIDGTFLKITYETDSYGENDYLTELKLVQKTTKEVVTYE